ncbi:hypothetical protein GWK47_015780 [Chionoecetes opilio]|uniref:Uncharacterized protein n=1 Tax=Chionoecetes opilio TaxID=41210 RepID=A0A8J5CKH9_CHIOP|nr:hypothetical protein GWK47_015780 [Chionoecetes opilio]
MHTVFCGGEQAVKRWNMVCFDECGPTLGGVTSKTPKNAVAGYNSQTPHAQYLSLHDPRGNMAMFCGRGRPSSGKLASLGRMSWLLDKRGVWEVLYKAQVRSSMGRLLGWVARPTSPGSLDKVKGRAVRLSGTAVPGRETTTSQPSAPPRRSGPHRDVQGASGSGCLTCTHSGSPYGGPPVLPKGARCSSPRRATTPPAAVLGTSSVSSSAFYVGWWNALLASQPRHGGTTGASSRNL